MLLSPLWRANLETQQKGRLHLPADAAFRYESDSQLWWLIMESVSWRSFQAVQVHCQLLPRKINTRAVLKDCCGAVIGHGDWGSPTAEQWWQDSSPENYIWRDGRWKPQVPFSVHRVLLVNLNERQVEVLITVKQVLNRHTAVCLTADLFWGFLLIFFLFIFLCCLMCWIARHPRGSQTHQQK